MPEKGRKNWYFFKIIQLLINRKSWITYKDKKKILTVSHISRVIERVRPCGIIIFDLIAMANDKKFRLNNDSAQTTIMWIMTKRLNVIIRN